MHDDQRGRTILGLGHESLGGRLGCIIVIPLMDLLALFSLDQVERWFEWGGYFILFGLLFACGLGLPLPEDIPLLLGGYFVALGQMNIVWVGVLAWLGIIGGD